MSSKHYVNNKTLFEALIEYKKKVNEAKANDLPKPRIPNYVGDCFLQIATRLSTKPNFVNYTYRDEMISDALENCISVVDNFDPEKSSNPFAYFTQIIHYAFLRRILKEKKHLYIKYKTMQNAYLTGALSHQQEIDELKEVDASYLDNEYMNNLVKQYEETVEEKRIKSKMKKKGLEKFIDE